MILDKPLQDVQFAAQYRCTGGCRAGVMLRTQVTIDGIRGAYVELPNGSNPTGSFALKLDSQGHEVSRQSLKSAGGMVRFMVPPSPPPGAGTGSARRRVFRAETCRPDLLIPVPTMLISPISGILLKPYLMPISCACGFMMVRNQVQQTAKLTTMLQSSDL